MVVAADNLSVHFSRGFRAGKLRAVDELTLNIAEGEFFALLGENGAGKSTLMHAFLGLIRPTSGRVTFFGEPPLLGSVLYERIAYLPEEPHYPDYLTIGEAIDFYRRLHRRRASRERIASLVDRLGLGDFLNLRIAKCSKGMKQKVGIIQALLNEPALLFLDEPMRGLDPIAVRDFRDILVDMHRDGATIVMNSHILSEVQSVASRVAILRKGKVVADDTVEHLLESESGSYVIDVSGISEVPNYIRVTESNSGRLKGKVDAAQLADFVAFATAAGAKLHSCELEKRTLEDSYLRVLRGEDAPHA